MLLSIVKWASKPFNVIFPIPIIPLIVGFIAGDLGNFWKPLLVTYTFYPAINLWNHINDAKDDFRAGKDNPFIDPTAKNIGIAIALLLYSTSALVVYSLGGWKSLVLYFIVFIATFVYSDNTITKLRMKKHYLTELAVYLVSVPVYILLLYSVIKPIDILAIKISILFLPLMISTLFVKDLKDLSADREAGLRTLGVSFRPEILVKAFSVCIFIYFGLIIILFYRTLYLLSAFPIIGVVIGIFGLKKNNWFVTKKSVIHYLRVFNSSLLSLIIFLLVAMIHTILSP